MNMLSWIASITLLLLTAFFIAAFLAFATSPNTIRMDVALACIAAAGLLLLPPLWRNAAGMKWRYGRIVAAVLLAAMGFLMPFGTHAVKLTLPRPSAPAHR